MSKGLPVKNNIPKVQNESKPQHWSDYFFRLQVKNNIPKVQNESKPQLC